jgi:uncharacterized protein (TIGR00369 family)
MTHEAFPPRSPEEIKAVARNALGVPLLRLLQAALVKGDDPTAGTVITVSGDALNAVDTLHAGAIATLLEITAYLALLPSLGRDEEAATHAFSSSYMRAGLAGDELRCRATVLHRSRRLAVVAAELRRGDELVANATVTKSILRSRLSLS